MLLTAIKAAKTAGRLIKKRYEREPVISYTYKDAHNIVSKTDLEAEKVILDILQGVYPAHSFFSEEAGMIDRGSEYLWIIDPLDGTTNFTHKFGHFAVSIALGYRGKTILGVVYDVMRDRLFTAQEEKSAFLNGEKIAVGNRKKIGEAVALFNRSANAIEKVRFGDIFRGLATQVRTIRIFGSAALDCVYAASGKFDAMVGTGLKFYDCAAGVIIAKEAGATVSDFAGKEWTFAKEKSDVLIANPLLHEAFIKSINHA